MNIKYLCGAVAATLMIGALPARADLMQVSSRAGLRADDSIVWSSLGPDLTPLTPPVALTSQHGRAATLSGSTAFTIFSGSTYNADFLPGDTVLSSFDLNTFTALTTGIRIAFAAPIHGVGAQVQANLFGPFTATLELFDASNTSLGSVQVGSTVLGNGDGSAPFLGAFSTAAVSSILFSSDQAGIAINELSVNSVPEPSSILLLVSAVAALALRRRRA